MVLTASGPRTTSYFPGSMSSGFCEFFDSSNASSPTSPDSISSSVLAPLCDDPEDVSVLKIPSINALVVESDDSRPFVFQTK